jgi:hypothetical protein
MRNSTWPYSIPRLEIRRHIGIICALTLAAMILLHVIPTSSPVVCRCCTISSFALLVCFATSDSEPFEFSMASMWAIEALSCSMLTAMADDNNQLLDGEKRRHDIKASLGA